MQLTRHSCVGDNDGLIFARTRRRNVFIQMLFPSVVVLRVGRCELAVLCIFISVLFAVDTRSLDTRDMYLEALHDRVEIFVALLELIYRM